MLFDPASATSSREMIALQLGMPGKEVRVLGPWQSVPAELLCVDGLNEPVAAPVGWPVVSAWFLAQVARDVLGGRRPTSPIILPGQVPVSGRAGPGLCGPRVPLQHVRVLHRPFLALNCLQLVSF